MPVVTTTPYVTANDVLDLARSISNDAAQDIAGDILANDQPYTFTMLEACYELLQDILANAGVNTFSEYAVIQNLTPVATPDPGVQVELSYTGYYDGVTNHASPTLPADMIQPLELWERWSGTENAWKPMKQASDHISTRPQQSAFDIWDFETDTIFLPGATVTIDLKMKYLLYAPKLVDGDSVVLIPRCTVALANMVAKMAAESRGGTQAAGIFAANAKEAIDRIIDRTAQKEQRAQFVRRPFRQRRGVRWGC